MASQANLFPHAPRRKLAETVAQQIRDAVRDLEPGTQLPSLADLTAQLGVGRSTIREALNGLETMGVIEVRHGQGVFVADRSAPRNGFVGIDRLSPEAVEARCLVEVEMAALAAQRRTADDLAAFDDLFVRHQQHLVENEGPIVEASKFHLLVLEAARNEILASVVRPFLQLAFERGPALYQTEEGYAEWELDQHRGIYEAIRDADGELARQRMRDHVNAMGSRYLPAKERSARRRPTRAKA